MHSQLKHEGANYYNDVSFLLSSFLKAKKEKRDAQKHLNVVAKLSFQRLWEAACPQIPVSCQKGLKIHI